jgi:hypothetical protein
MVTHCSFLGQRDFFQAEECYKGGAQIQKIEAMIGVVVHDIKLTKNQKKKKNQRKGERETERDRETQRETERDKERL